MERNCTIRVAKAKALISFFAYLYLFTVTAKLICAFVLHMQNVVFLHDAARFMTFADLSRLTRAI